jgi:hypothetical protein
MKKAIIVTNIFAFQWIAIKDVLIFIQLKSTNIAYICEKLRESSNFTELINNSVFKIVKLLNDQNKMNNIVCLNIQTIFQ